MIIKRYENGRLCLVIEVDENKKRPKPTVEIQDRAAGYRDRLYGMYNEWYRRNRIDGGMAYERGYNDADRELGSTPSVVKIYV